MEKIEKIENIKSYIYLEDFIKEHKKRLRTIKQINKKYQEKKLTFQLCILGIEGLAKYYRPNLKSKERFIILLSKVMRKKDAEEFYTLFRCSYIHVGFPNPILDWEDDDNLNLAGMSWKDVDKVFPGANVDYPRETIISIYEELIYGIEDYFKKKGIKYRIFKDVQAVIDSEYKGPKKYNSRREPTNYPKD